MKQIDKFVQRIVIVNTQILLELNIEFLQCISIQQTDKSFQSFGSFSINFPHNSWKTKFSLFMAEQGRIKKAAK